MQPTGDLDIALAAFKNLKFTSQTVYSSEVLLDQYVRFPYGCRDQAMEIVAPVHIQNSFKYESFEYLILRGTVSGPYTTENRIQMIDDCKIEIYTKMQPYIEGVTNVWVDPEKMPKPPTTSAKVTAASNAKPSAASSGCHSHESSNCLFVLLIMFFLFKEFRFFLLKII